MKHYCTALGTFVLLFATLVFDAHSADKTKIVFVAGEKSHSWGAHEHKAGCMLLAEQLNKNMPNVNAVVTTGGWPEDNSIFDDAAIATIPVPVNLERPGVLKIQQGVDFQW